MISKTETITISVKDYVELKKRSHFLQLLQDKGVDSWEGYSAVSVGVEGDEERECVNE